ncbi:MAG: 50S ribosomal protein L35 [Planctomycetota bacterium]|jgi:large subunit ribosomal protein L35|nr:50S ribosomal protein L35 [Planctomycetota bacterium]MDP7131949.1 50S ribosomal protein L35 [Planctomycetota bacterium]MDP7252036.1 50S ribosomal protein L35 [Planctomycetota bacterium]
MKSRKPHKGISKRVKITARGKVLRHKAGRRHLLSVKNGKRLRHLRRKVGVGHADAVRIKALLGVK